MKIDKNDMWSVKGHGLIVGFCYYVEIEELEKKLQKFKPELYNTHYKPFRKKLKQKGVTLFFDKQHQYDVEKEIRKFKNG